MFKITTNPQFTHPVTVLVPVDGGHEKQTFKVTFRVIDSDETQEDKHDLNTVAGSIAFCREVIVSFQDLADDNDQPLEYSDRVRDQLLKLAYVRTPIARAYYDAITKATLGN